jgi:cellobiose-specific phosphotransferase system component IIC
LTFSFSWRIKAIIIIIIVTVNYMVFKAQADWTFILPSEVPAKVLRHLPRNMPPRVLRSLISLQQHFSQQVAQLFRREFRQ